MTVNLDERLTDAAPDRELAPTVVAELGALGIAARIRGESRSRHTRRTLVGAAALGVALLGGTTAAAASGVLPWTGWTNDPDAVVRLDYVATTSGGLFTCEVAMHIDAGLDADVAEAARSYLAGVDQDAPLGDVGSETSPLTPEDFPESVGDVATREAILSANWWVYRVWVGMTERLGAQSLVDYDMTMPSETHCEPLP